MVVSTGLPSPDRSRQYSVPHDAPPMTKISPLIIRSCIRTALDAGIPERCADARLRCRDEWNSTLRRGEPYTSALSRSGRRRLRGTGKSNLGRSRRTSLFGFYSTITHFSRSPVHLRDSGSIARSSSRTGRSSVSFPDERCGARGSRRMRSGPGLTTVSVTRWGTVVLAIRQSVLYETSPSTADRADLRCRGESGRAGPVRAMAPIRGSSCRERSGDDWVCRGREESGGSSDAAPRRWVNISPFQYEFLNSRLIFGSVNGQ